MPNEMNSVSTGRNYGALDPVILAACFLISLAAFFLPWANVLMTRISAFDLFSGAFSDEPTIYRSGILLLALIPCLGLVALGIDLVRRKLTWLAYLFIGLAGCISVAAYLRVSTGEVAVFLSAIAFLRVAVYAIAKMYRARQKSTSALVH